MQASFIKIIDMETLKVLFWERHDYCGPVALCKSSKEEEALMGEQADFYKQLQGMFATQFANQSNILTSLTNTFKPIMQAGPGQFGFTPEEAAAMRTGATEQVAGAYKNASTAVSERMAASGGGNTFMPSGASAEVQAEFALAAAGKQADTQNLITQEGYATGRDNFYRAAGVLGNVAEQYNPLGFAGATDTSGANAFGAAHTVNQENVAWKGQIGADIAGAVHGGVQGAAAASGG